MQARKFELFMGCLGNGTTVCNKAVEEHGDYKKVAHISPAGNITWYVKPTYVPPDDMKRIISAAERDRADFIHRLSLEAKSNPAAIFEKMLDALPYSVCMEYLDDKTGTKEERQERLIKLYLANS